MSVGGEKTEQKQERAISALLQAPSLKEAAKEAGISEATLHRWLKDNAFKEAYRAAKREVVNHAICRLQRSSGQAVKTLEDVMRDGESPATSRVSAAKIILEMALKGVEVEDLEKRIEVLERKYEERSK
jgi:DNA-binding MurR/RpiR family transcriptional regulator